MCHSADSGIGKIEKSWGERDAGWGRGEKRSAESKVEKVLLGWYEGWRLTQWGALHICHTFIPTYLSELESWKRDWTRTLVLFVLLTLEKFHSPNLPGSSMINIYERLKPEAIINDWSKVEKSLKVQELAGSNLVVRNLIVYHQRGRCQGVIISLSVIDFGCIQGKVYFHFPWQLRM